jgi:hypothetical protein
LPDPILFDRTRRADHDPSVVPQTQGDEWKAEVSEEGARQP